MSLPSPVVSIPSSIDQVSTHSTKLPSISSIFAIVDAMPQFELRPVIQSISSPLSAPPPRPTRNPQQETVQSDEDEMRKLSANASAMLLSLQQAVSGHSNVTVGTPIIPSVTEASRTTQSNVPHQGPTADELAESVTRCSKNTDHPYKCPFEGCGRLCDRPSTFKTHLRTHTGERPFQCQFCSMTFGAKGTLNSHMRIHLNERPFKCECGKSFRQSTHLSRHRLSKKKCRPAQSFALGQ